MIRQDIQYWTAADLAPARLVAFAGASGSAKNLAAEQAKKHGFMVFQLGDQLRDAISREGGDTSREGIIQYALNRKRLESSDIIVVEAVESWHKQRDRSLGGLAMSGHFSLNEAVTIQRLGTLYYLEADEAKRFARSQERGRSDVPADIAESRKQEALERSPLDAQVDRDWPNLGAIENLAGVIKIPNNGTIGELLARLDELVYIPH